MEKYNYELRIMNYELICVPAEDGLKKPVLVFPLGFNRKVHLMLLEIVLGNNFPSLYN